MAWCLQCGIAGRTERAIGIDEDGEHACGLHAVNRAGVETVKVSAVQPEKSKPMQSAPAVSTSSQSKTCPGVLGKPCGKEIGARAEVCGACYARRLYHQNKPKTAKKPKKLTTVPAKVFASGTTDLAALKAKLLAGLADIEVVEKLAGLIG